MPAQAEIINLNDASPAAPSGKTDIKWQKGPQSGTDPTTGYPIFPVSAYMPLMVGDSGSGGTSGAVPAPTAGDAAAGKFLKADGTFALPPGTGVPTSRFINTTAPLTGGGDLSADRTLAISVATTSAVGVVKPDGSTILIDGMGKISASAGAINTTHSESLTDGNSNFIFAAGDIVTVIGVPN